MVEAATEFRKNGFNDSDAATLAKTATMFQNVSDEAISAGDSASFIISQMIAFGIEAENAQSIIDKVNETANKFSVSSGDLSKALGIVASTSSAMGNSIDQTLGVVTAITEQTRNASKSARAANTIFSRLAQVVDENSDTGKKLTEIYNNLGIALYDSSGQMRSTYDILADLASKWDSLDKNTQQYIAITSAGTNQLNNFLALMNNFDHAAEATATSLNSAGSAMRENEAFQESLEYQTNNLKATFQDLANDVIDKELISSILKLSNAFLELTDTGLGQFIAKTALLGGTAWGLSSLVKVTKIIPVITSQFKNLASVIGMISNPAVISSIGGIGTALSTVGGFAGVALPMLLGISAALVGIVELVDYIENKDVRKLENLSSAIQDTNDKIAEMSGAGSEYETLINNADKLTEKEQARLGVLQAQLDNLKEQAAEQEAAYLKEWQDQQTKQRTETVHELVTGSATEVPEGATKLYGQYWDVATTTEYTDSQRAAENLRTAINKLNSEKRQGVTVGNEYISKLQGIIDEYQETYDTTIKVRDAGYELDDSQEYLIKVMEHQKEVIAGLGEEYAKNSEDISQFANALDESVSKLDTYIDALDQYRGANEDAATAGDILVQSLFDTNGELTEAAKQALTTDSAMASMAQSFIEAQQAQAQADFSALILAIQEVGNAAMITSSQIANMMAMAGVNIGVASSGTASANLQRTYKDITGKTAASDEAAYKSWMQSYLYEKGQASYQRKMEAYQKQLSQIRSYVPSGGGGGGGGSSSTKKDQEEVKAQTINTVEELREYLTDEETRLKLIDPDISKSDLQSTLSEVANIYQSYQNYLSQLKQQGFDETSEQYKQAEAEFAQFVDIIKNLLMSLLSDGKYSIDEIMDYVEKNCGNLSDMLSGMLDTVKSKVSSTVASIGGSLNQAFASGDANSIINSIEHTRDMISAMGDSIEEQYDAAVQNALKNAAAESSVAEEVAEEYDRQNQLLEDKIALEEKLEALEKAKQRRMLVYSEGRFQYMQDADAISSAQKDYQETYRGIEQSQTKDLMSMLGDESKAFFEKYFSNGGDVPNYPNALRKHLLQYVKGQISGTVYEGMSEEGLYNTFGEAMKPGDAYKQILIAYNEAQEAREERRQREAELKKQIREENVKYYGVDTDFGEKIKNAQSQNEVAYWTELRDTKQQMIKEYREAYGDEAASKYFGTDVSKQDTWASNRDLYKEAYESGSNAWRTSKSEFYTGDPNYKYGGYTEKNPDLTVAQYNAATAVDMEGFGDQRLYDRIFSESITKDEIQDLYDKSQSDISKGYLLNLASEMHKAGYPGYARGTRHANRGLSLVGENGPELRVLNHGDGILPSGITDNLWRWGSMTPKDMLASLAQKAQSWAQTLNISNVTLPNVRDAQSFVSGLRELAQQYVTRRS